ncbi:MAG TPA: ATP-binding protein [Polyangia bacterium]
MELDQEKLKEKAILLLQRERELFELRIKHERATAWLNLAQALPQIFAEPNFTMGGALARLRKALLQGLKVQRVSFQAIEPEGLRPIAPEGPVRPLSLEMRALLLGEAVGVVNDQSGGGSGGVSELFGLTRFIWTRIDLAGGEQIVLVAGYDASKAKFFSGFDGGDAANLRNTGQHIQGLIGKTILTKELQAANETLEQRVVERTTQLERRNHDMRLVLDNVVTALATIDVEGRLAEERSATLDEWFGAYAGTPRFVDYIAKADPAFAETFAVAHDALVEGFMPRELCLDQLPTRIQSGARTFQCAYRSISGGGAGDGGLLIIIEDVTERLRLAQEEAEQSELLAVFQSLTRDRAGFLTFFEEAGRMVQDLASGTLDDVVRKRHLHTLKGNAAMVGAKVVADLCHRAEEELAIDGTGIAPIVARLQDRWRAIGATLQSVLGTHDDALVEIPVVALDQLRKDVLAGASPRSIEQRLASFELEPIERPLRRLAQHATAVAARLGKADLSVEIESDGSRFDARRFAPLWASLVHLIRNGVDHGIEPPSERIARGKQPGGRMILRAGQTGRALTVEVEDDGNGIDWDAVVKLADARGLPHETPSDLLGVVLSDGFTTRAQASSTSGRGVGMAAVAQAVASLGGELSVRSQRGLGTCWCAVVPLPSEVLAPAAALGAERVGGGSPDQLFPLGTQS